MSRRFTFVGVTTASSSIMRIFPRWRELLGLPADVEMSGWDLPVDASGECFREVVARIRDDPANLGALVTTHKIGVYRAGRELFDRLDDDATLCEEVSCIAKRGSELWGWAKDPLASGRALAELLADDHFAGGAEALCMGAGGSGIALAVHLAARRPDAPARILLTDVGPERRSRALRIMDRAGVTGRVEVLNGAGDHGDLLKRLPPGSLVVNATGLGKDRPGSPLPGGARFPERGIAWELNYRGSLEFLRQAEAQRAERELVVEDGWRYFVHGWTSVMEEVFERPIAAHEVEALARAAAFARPAKGA